MATRSYTELTADEKAMLQITANAQRQAIRQILIAVDMAKQAVADYAAIPFLADLVSSEVILREEATVALSPFAKTFTKDDMQYNNNTVLGGLVTATVGDANVLAAYRAAVGVVIA